MDASIMPQNCCYNRKLPAMGAYYDEIVKHSNTVAVAVAVVAAADGTRAC